MEKIQIVVDSSCDLNDKLKGDINPTIIPFTVEFGDKSLVDDESFDQVPFLKEMNEFEDAPKTAAPSPNLYLEAYGKAMESFVITISSKLSASYNNALLAKDLFLENCDRKVHVFDSLTATAGETLTMIKLNEMIKSSTSFEDIVENLEGFIKNITTYFILDKYDNLIKNGRMSKLTGILASALSMKPIMGAEDGNIKLFEKARGYNKALKKLVEMVGEKSKSFKEQTMVIAHCNCLERAIQFKKDIEDKYDFKEIEIVNTAMLSSVYANDGGIVIAF